MAPTPERLAQGFRQFENGVVNRQEWSTPFARELCFKLVEKGISLRQFSLQIGIDYKVTWRWIGNGNLPTKKNVARVEVALTLPPKGLERFVPIGARDPGGRKSALMKKRWGIRRSNYGVEGTKERFKEGKFTNGKKPAEFGLAGAIKQIRAADGHPSYSRSIRAKLKQGVRLSTYGQPNAARHIFLLCTLCRKALGAPRSRYFKVVYGDDGEVKSSQPLHHNPFHEDCWLKWRQAGGNPKDHNKRVHRTTNAPNLDTLIPYWLEHHILGLSYGQIAENHKPKNLKKGEENPITYRAVGRAIDRAQKWIPSQWGMLFSTKRGIHSLLKYFSVHEVKQIAAGNHDLSQSITNEEVVAYAERMSNPEYTWDSGEISVSPLSQALADGLRGKYRTKREAAKAVGLNTIELTDLLYLDEQSLRKRRLNGKTWGKLSTFLGRPTEELKAMLGQDDLEVADTALAMVVGDAITAEGTSVHLIGLQIGLAHQVLYKILRDESKFLNASTFVALSKLTVESEQELRELWDKDHETWVSRSLQAGTEVPDTALARAVDATVRAQFKSVSAAARHAAMSPEVLTKVIRDQLKNLTEATIGPLGKLLRQPVNEIIELWEQDHETWATKPLANTKLARRISERTRGKYLTLSAAAKAIDLSPNGLKYILYSRPGFVTDSTAKALSEVLDLTVKEVEDLVKATSTTVESQTDVPPVPSPDAVQLSLMNT